MESICHRDAPEVVRDTSDTHSPTLASLRPGSPPASALLCSALCFSLLSLCPLLSSVWKRLPLFCSRLGTHPSLSFSECLFETYLTNNISQNQHLCNTLKITATTPNDHPTAWFQGRRPALNPKPVSCAWFHRHSARPRPAPCSCCTRDRKSVV